MRFDLGESISILQATPAALQSLLASAPEHLVRANDGPGTWSPFDVIGHLIHGERTDWIPRSALILAGGEARFAPFDRTAHVDASAGLSLAQLLDEFAQLRTANLETLLGWEVTAEQLEWNGIHPEFGSVTLAQVLATWAAHDLAHMVQITRVMARQYREAVGPFAKYLSVMNPS